MATITYTDNGEQKTVPMWATESQMEALLKHFGASGGKEKMEKVTETLVERIKDLNEAVNELSDSNDELVDEIDDIADDINDKFESVGLNFQSMIGGAFGLLGDAVDFVVGTGLAVLGTAITAITAKIVQLGSNFTELSQSGLALEGSTAMTLASMNELGYSTGEATKAMLNNSLVFASMGTQTVPGVIESFLDMTSAGLDLGLTLGDARDLILDELSMRAGLVNLGALTDQQQRQAVQRIAQVNRQQVVYSKALGVSTDAMRDFADQVIGNNQMLLANIVRLPNTVRMELTTGLTEFISGMRAMGGEAGGEIGAAVLEAASMGAIGFSEAAFSFITVLPSLADNMQGVIEDFSNGVINGHEAAMAFTNELGNLSEAEKNRVFLLARAGDEQAKAMASAIQQFEISAKRMKDQGVDFETFQTGMNAFNAVVEQGKGAFSSLINNFMEGFGEGTGEAAEFMKNLAAAFQRLMHTVFGIDTAAGSTSNTMRNLGEKIGKNLIKGIDMFANWLAGTIEFLKGYFAGLAGDSIGEKVASMFKDVGNRIVEVLKDALIAGLTSPLFIGLVAGAIGVSMAKGFAMQKGAQLAGGAVSSVGGAAAAGGGAAAGGIGAGLKGLAAGVQALGVLPIPVILKAAAAIAVLGAALIPLTYALSLLAPIVESMGKAIGSILTGLAPIVEAFGRVIEGMGNAIASVFNAIGGIIESVGSAIAGVMDSITRMKVGKINAEAEAMVKTTEATKNAILELAHLDPEQIMGIATGVDAMGGALESFADVMTPGFLDTLGQGFASLFGAQSPIQAVMEFSNAADPNKMMDVAKAVMAANAANAGATTLDDSLRPSTDPFLGGGDAGGGGGAGGGAGDNKDMTDLLEALLIQGEEHTNQLKNANRKLSGIEGNL